jgi:hypothetical protein
VTERTSSNSTVYGSATLHPNSFGKGSRLKPHKLHKPAKTLIRKLLLLRIMNLKIAIDCGHTLIGANYGSAGIKAKEVIKIGDKPNRNRYDSLKEAAKIKN